MRSSIAAFAVVLSAPVMAQAPIEYEVSFNNAVHPLARDVDAIVFMAGCDFADFAHGARYPVSVLVSYSTKATYVPNCKLLIYMKAGWTNEQVTVRKRTVAVRF